MSMSGRSDFLIRLVEMGQTERVKKLVDSKEYDVNEEDDLGNTPLIVAVKGNRDDILEYLISNNAIVPEQDNIGRNLIEYAKNREFSTVVELLKNAMKKQKININKSTDLNVANQNKGSDSKSVDLQLINTRQYDVDESDDIEDDDAPVVVAIKLNRVPILKYLIERGDFVPQEDNMGRNLIEYAKKRKFLEIVKLLEALKEKQKINIAKSTELDNAKQDKEENFNSADTQLKLSMR